MDRQQAIEEGSDFQPICLFAEGSTTNGTKILKFKRGAFVGMRAVQPCFIKFTHGMVRPTYDIIEFWDLIILLIASFSTSRVTVFIMPPFRPN